MMTKQWEYQIRVFLDEEKAIVARKNPIDSSLRPLDKILSKHQACLKCQYDAFSEYCALAEKSGVEANLRGLDLWDMIKTEPALLKNEVLITKGAEADVGGPLLFCPLCVVIL